MRRLISKKGLLKLGEGVWAYIQPDGSWGLNNAGLVTDAAEARKRYDAGMPAFEAAKDISRRSLCRLRRA
jgi:hypothetical protein